jgi:hypothetical protein
MAAVAVYPFSAAVISWKLSKWNAGYRSLIITGMAGLLIALSAVLLRRVA